MITPPPYTSNRSRSPSLNDQYSSEMRTEQTFRYHTPSPPTSDIEIIPIPKQTSTVIQSLVENTPVVSTTVTQPTNTNQLNYTSNSSLNNTERCSRTSSSMDVDVPKLNAPLIPLASNSSKKDSKRTKSPSHHDDTYNSTSTISQLVRPNRSNTNTYSSLPETNTISNENIKPIKSNCKFHFSFI